MFKDKILLITGGTGSFGGAILERFLDTNIKEIRIFSRDEKKQDELRLKFQNEKLKFYIGDVRDKESLKDAVKGCNYVFSAAALKQVPSCEFYPMEAVKTNVYGTANTIDAAIQEKIERLIVLSTDKAVYPINVMGMTKALMEKVMISKSINNNVTVLSGTRYGNVMASRGSVIPLFVSQILENKPITVTNPEMTRFMMSLDEAVNLVIYTFENAQQGDIFVQKSPASTIINLVNCLYEIFNKKPEIKIIGTRHGEKLFESLLTKEEAVRAIDLGDYYRIPADTRDLNYSKYFEQGNTEVDFAAEYTSHNTVRLDSHGLKKILMDLPIIKDALR